MSLPPLPWSYSEQVTVGQPPGYGFVYLLDATGRKIGTLWGRPAEKIAVAEFILAMSDQFGREFEVTRKGLKRT